MKATLEFNLPEDAHEHATACSAGALAAALHDVSNEIRNVLKYQEPSAETRRALEALRDLIPSWLLDL